VVNPGLLSVRGSRALCSGGGLQARRRLSRFVPASAEGPNREQRPTAGRWQRPFV
jgi:hypothetical protein